MVFAVILSKAKDPGVRGISPFRTNQRKAKWVLFRGRPKGRPYKGLVVSTVILRIVRSKLFPHFAPCSAERSGVRGNGC